MLFSNEFSSSFIASLIPFLQSFILIILGVFIVLPRLRKASIGKTMYSFVPKPLRGFVSLLVVALYVIGVIFFSYLASPLTPIAMGRVQSAYLIQKDREVRLHVHLTFRQLGRSRGALYSRTTLLSLDLKKNKNSRLSFTEFGRPSYKGLGRQGHLFLMSSPGKSVCAYDMIRNQKALCAQDLLQGKGEFRIRAGRGPIRALLADGREVKLDFAARMNPSGASIQELYPGSMCMAHPKKARRARNGLMHAAPFKRKRGKCGFKTASGSSGTLALRLNPARNNASHEFRFTGADNQILWTAKPGGLPVKKPIRFAAIQTRGEILIFATSRYSIGFLRLDERNGRIKENRRLF